jgi:hypothetical protein
MIWSKPYVSNDWHFVKGHRDKEDEILDTWETHNIAMDLKAEVFHDMLQTSIDIQPTWNPVLSGDTWTIYCLTLSALEKLYRNGFWTVLHLRTCKHSGLVFNGCPYKVSEKWAGRQSLWHWISNHARNNCGTNATLIKQQQKQSDACIRCGAMSETAIHVWTCHQNGGEAIYELLQSLGLWLHTPTSRTICKLLANSLLEWRTGDIDNTDNAFIELLKHQDIVGWDHVIEGCISQARWREVHQQHLDTIKCNKSSLNFLFKSYGV